VVEEKGTRKAVNRWVKVCGEQWGEDCRMWLRRRGWRGWTKRCGRQRAITLSVLDWSWLEWRLIRVGIISRTSGLY